MIDLHERLSEFSYGYGVTRDVEQLLASVGIRAVPFLPSLLQEKQLGFDVGFGERGVPLLLQFKLGQTLRRFVRSDKSYPAPLLQKPFFRFSINTAEPDGQFEALLKAQTDGAEVYYVAPRFADWPQYVQFFESCEVLERSVMITPGEIRQALLSRGLPDGPHRIVYDRSRAHVCSEPIEVSDVRPQHIAHTIGTRIRADEVTLGRLVHQLYDGLENRSTIRRESPDRMSEHDEETTAEPARALDQRAPEQITRHERDLRLTAFRNRARSLDDAIAAALAFEFWSLGIQLLFAVEEKTPPTSMNS
jgi:hypothetical protein